MSTTQLQRRDQELGIPLPTMNVGLLGFGTVGSGVYSMLEANRKSISAKLSTELQILKAGIRDPNKPRLAPAELFTTDLESIVDDPEIDIVVEVIGGESTAGVLIERALRNGKHVVTANKELIAKHGPRLLQIAAESGLDLHFEAAVGGGIPLIQPLKHQLSGNRVLKLMGILNGTTNYILTQMSRGGATLSNALARAQQHGYAEQDPTNDIGGHDVRYKLSILSSIAFGAQVCPEEIYCEGLERLEPRDFELARMFGYELKLLGIAEETEHGVLARVHPVFLPKHHPMSRVSGVDNALFVRGDFVGDLLFSGKGAGADPTASAVVGDLIDVARNIRLGGSANTPLPSGKATTVPIESLDTRFYLRVEVDDEPSVLGAIATVLGRHGVSLSAMEMKVLSLEERLGEIVFFTHACRDERFRKALAEVAGLNVIRRIANWIRMEGEPSPDSPGDET